MSDSDNAARCGSCGRKFGLYPTLSSKVDELGRPLCEDCGGSYDLRQLYEMQRRGEPLPKEMCKDE